MTENHIVEMDHPLFGTLMKVYMQEGKPARITFQGIVFMVIHDGGVMKFVASGPLASMTGSTSFGA